LAGMLTDIFARRYEKRPIFTSVDQRELKLLVQAFRIVNEQLLPYYDWQKKVDERSKATWTSLHNRLSMELGIKELSPTYYSYQGEWMGKPHTYSGFYEMNQVCEAYVTKAYSNQWDPDVFMKNRLSFVELAFRERESQIMLINSHLPGDLLKAKTNDAKPPRSGSLRAPGIPLSNVERVQKQNDHVNAVFNTHVHELNTRFEQAGTPLNYHNGYIQITTDALVEFQIAQPFWALVKEAKWANVSTDMAESLDRRDTGGRDPAFYAAKSLESTIKIISEERKWITGNEKGVSDYLNHLEAKANGPFIAPWERQLMQKFFSDVRNDFGHGPGSAPMPNLSVQQTDFAIEFCMSWIKSLIKRL
jgi:hypothetical protein